MSNPWTRSATDSNALNSSDFVFVNLEMDIVTGDGLSLAGVSSMRCFQGDIFSRRENNSLRIHLGTILQNVFSEKSSLQFPPILQDIVSKPSLHSTINVSKSKSNIILSPLSLYYGGEKGLEAVRQPGILGQITLFPDEKCSYVLCIILSIPDPFLTPAFWASTAPPIAMITIQDVLLATGLKPEFLEIPKKKVSFQMLTMRWEAINDAACVMGFECEIDAEGVSCIYKNTEFTIEEFCDAFPDMKSHVTWYNKKWILNWAREWVKQRQGKMGGSCPRSQRSYPLYATYQVWLKMKEYWSKEDSNATIPTSRKLSDLSQKMIEDHRTGIINTTRQ
ncbi:hypothetical protein C8J56DRAFT_1062701 [Mycena floridula]|nr:hypothetical protein C8J56DRAFT_1062701 [Mycena floridula]